MSPLQVHPRSHWAATRSWMYLLRQQDPVYGKVRFAVGNPRAQDNETSCSVAVCTLADGKAGELGGFRSVSY